MMKRLVRLSGSTRSGPWVLMWTVSGSTATTSRTEDSNDFICEDGACARLSENTTSAAVSGVPSWNLTPGRSLNAQTEGSSVCFQLSASAPCSELSASRITSGSYIWCSRLKLRPTLTACGSSVAGSAERAQRTGVAWVAASGSSVVDNREATSSFLIILVLRSASGPCRGCKNAAFRGRQIGRHAPPSGDEQGSICSFRICGQGVNAGGEPTLHKGTIRLHLRR